MTRRRGFVLITVLAALVIMAMVVAVSAQRALVTARQGRLDLVRVELALAVAAAEAAVLDAPVDSIAAYTALPGTVLAAGEATAGAARATWTVVGTLAPIATAEVEAQAPALRGAARTWHRLLVTPVRDTLGARRWKPAGGAGWTQLPSP